MKHFAPAALPLIRAAAVRGLPIVCSLAAGAAGAVFSAAAAPLPQTAQKADSVGAVIHDNEDSIRRQILESDSAESPGPPPGKAPAAAKLRQRARESAPVPAPAPRAAERNARQPESAPLAAETPAPAFTTPAPIPVPMPIPEPVPLSPPAEDGGIAPQAVPYEAAPRTPLTYPQQPKASAGFPRFGDRKPHIWTSRRKPWHYAIHGTDVSWHNRAIDWSAMARGRISFVFIKATEGGDHSDPAFRQNWQAAKAVGLARGAYHFYYFCRPAKDQLRWYIQNVPRDKYAMPPVLDIEWNHTSVTCRRRPPAAVVRKEMRIFLQGAEKHYGKRPIIYTTVDFFRDNDLSAFRGYPFWLRSVAAHPDERYKNHPWLFWQYTGTGRVPGMAGDADINVFVGSAGQWQSWLRTIRR